MRIPNAEHRAHPWVIEWLAPDFELLDAWALPAEGAREDFRALLDAMASLDPAHATSLPSRVLFWVRLKLGALLGWDDEGTARPIPGCTETSLADRLPADLRGSVEAALDGAPMPDTRGFDPLYLTEVETAAEISNATVHGVLHLGWVEFEPGRYRGQLGVYVKPRGAMGRAYLAAIAPFRHLVVYPALMRTVDRVWRARERPAPR